MHQIQKKLFSRFRRRWVKRLGMSVGFCLIVSSLLNPSISQAQTTSAFSISISPPVTYLSLRPGQKSNPTITIRHEGTTPLSITPRLVEFEADPRGSGVRLTDHQTFAYLDQSQPSALDQSFTLQPGEKKTFSLPIAIPQSANTGESHLTVLFASSPLTTTDLTATQTEVAGTIGSNLIVMVSADGQDLSQLQPDRYQGPKFIDSFSSLSFQLGARNDGPLAGVATGSAELVSGSGQVLKTWRFFPDIILAHSQRLLRTPSEDLPSPTDRNEEQILEPNQTFNFKAPFMIGLYQINVTLGPTDQPNQAKMSYPVIALPFSVGVLIIVCLGALIGYKILIRKLPIGKRLKTY